MHLILMTGSVFNHSVTTSFKTYTVLPFIYSNHGSKEAVTGQGTHK